MNKSQCHSKSKGISIPEDLLSKIDEDRGYVPRSRFIVRIMEQLYFEKGDTKNFEYK